MIARGQAIQSGSPINLSRIKDTDETVSPVIKNKLFFILMLYSPEFTE